MAGGRGRSRQARGAWPAGPPRAAVEPVQKHRCLESLPHGCPQRHRRWMRWADQSIWSLEKHLEPWLVPERMLAFTMKEEPPSVPVPPEGGQGTAPHARHTRSFVLRGAPSTSRGHSPLIKPS